MQIRVNTSDNQVINTGNAVNNAAKEQSAQRAGRRGQKIKRQSVIFAGEFGLQNDMITQRRQRAQRKAFKMISDAWNSDRKIDQNIKDIKDKLSALYNEKRENLDILAEGAAQKEALRQQYSVEMDSQEQKDLELLEKEGDSYIYPDKIQLTEEEQERLEQLHKEPRTEYQERCLKIDSYLDMFKRKNNNADSLIEAYNGSIRATKLERLKFHGMVDAQKKADEVMEAASQDIIGMLIDEGKEHVDEELEKKIEEAKEKAEEKEKEEEKIEERKKDQIELEARIDEAHEKNEEREELRKEAEARSREEADLLSDMIDAGMGGVGNISSAQSDIKNMLHKMKLLEEDLKGNIIDEEL